MNVAALSLVVLTLVTGTSPTPLPGWPKAPERGQYTDARNAGAESRGGEIAKNTVRSIGEPPRAVNTPQHERAAESDEEPSVEAQRWWALQEGTLEAAWAGVWATRINVGVTLLLGALTIYFLYRTMAATAHAANAAVDNAKAAKAAAALTQTLERPRLAFKLLALEGAEKLIMQPQGVLAAVLAGQSPYVLRARCNFVNGGRSPALITALNISFGNYDITKLPPEPPYIANPQFRPRLVLPGEGTEENWYEWHLSIEQVELVRSEKRHLLIFGHVMYRGPIPEGPEFETRFCVVGRFFEGGISFFREGPPAWTQYA